MDLNFARRVVVITILFLVPFRLASAQQPAASPPQTGRSYEIGNLPKTPPTPGPQGKSPVLFTDITTASKINFRHASSPTSNKFLLETMGGGVAVFDFNNDGRMDLFFTNGALLHEDMAPDAVPEKSEEKFWNRLYQQQVDGTFQDVTERAGLKGSGYSMESYDHAYGLRFVALRYFNACGAAGKLGEDHDPETHLIPNVLRAALGKIPYVSVFGNNYPTPDGTAVRDYIHVSDLADAHARALDYLRDGGKSERINLGNGHGYSVLEVIEAARQVTGRPIEVRIEPPRSGDPSKLVANAEYARTLLAWQPAYPDLSSILESDWNWRLKHPDGYVAD